LRSSGSFSQVCAHREPLGVGHQVRALGAIERGVDFREVGNEGAVHHGCTKLDCFDRVLPAVLDKRTAHEHDRGEAIEDAEFAQRVADIDVGRAVGQASRRALHDLQSPRRRDFGDFRDAFRVLKSGGRLAISDIVASAELPEEVRHDLALYSGCMAGASLVDDLDQALREAGFSGIRIAPKDESSTIADRPPRGHAQRSRTVR
jgi:hypothetical protein